MITAHLKWTPYGYHYWVNVRGSLGWRQIGPEVLCIVDDFGVLVMIGNV